MADDTEERDIVATAKKFRKRSRAHFARWREEAREDYAFFAGDQWSQDDKTTLKEQLRPIITFNRIGPVVDAVSGAEVSNRQEVRYIPREMGDVGVNELLTGAAEWARDECNAEDEESDSFIDTVICGLGWTETRMDYDDDPEGKIAIERVDPIEIDPDPAATKRNLTDAKHIGRLKWVDREDVKAMWPDKADQIALIDKPDFKDFGDAVQPDTVSPGDDYDSPDTHSNEAKVDKVPVYEYQYCVRKVVHIVADPQTNQTMELTEGKYRRLAKRAQKVGLTLNAARQQRRVYRRAFMCGDVLLEDGDSPCPYSFTYKAITGKRDRNTNTWYGLVRAMKDPQKWANKFFSQILHIINSNAKGGAFAEKSAFVSPQKAEQDWANPAALILLNEGAVARGAIQERQAITYPAGLDKLMEFAVSSIRDVTGVNLEMLGLADRTQAGVLEYQRKQAGLTILATLFDGLRRYRKEQGRLLLHFIQTYISDGRLIRIAGQNGQERYIPLVRDQQTAKFDIIVDDAPSSPNQKEKTWGIITQMFPFVKDQLAASPKIMAEVLRYSPLPESFTQKITTTIEELTSQGPPPDPEIIREQNKLQVEQQRTQMQAQAKAHEIEVMRAKAAAEIQIAREKAEADMALKVWEAEQDAALAQQKMGLEMHLNERKAQFDAALSASQQPADAGPPPPDPLDNEVKMAEVETKRATAKKTLAEAESLTREMTKSEDAAKAIAALAKQASAALDKVERAVKRVEELAADASAPIEIAERDANGRVAALKQGKRKRKVVRGADNRISMIQ